MTIEEYQTIIKKTSIYPENIGLAYCAMGLTGEAGEVSDKIKKIYRDKDVFDSSGLIDQEKIHLEVIPEEKESIKKELGDVMWYITAMANELGLSLEEIMEANYNKLIKRRETNTLHGSGDDREINKQ